MQDLETQYIMIVILKLYFMNRFQLLNFFDFIYKQLFYKQEFLIKLNMPEIMSDNQQFSSEQEILLPKCNIFPANQIITKQYQPDQTPMMKLITRQVHKQKQQSKNRVNYNPSKNTNPQFVEYANLFGVQDFLGNYYADKIDQMIYFKFNNKEYNQLKVGEKKFRFFSGFFIDRQHFQDVAFQKHDNIMKSFPYLDFIQYNSNILQSFAKNTKGNLQDPKFSSNYDSANLFAVIKKKSFQYDLILQNDMNSKGNTQWFNFLVHFTEEGTYRFNIVNLTKSHSLYSQGMKILCYSFLKQSYRGNHQNQRAGTGWFHTGKNIRYFKNGIQRQTLGCNQSYYTLSFQYTCKNKAESIIFSHSYPYTNLDLEKYFNKILYRRIMSHSKMQKIFVCNSISGQPIYCYVISHRKIRSKSLKFNKTFVLNDIGQKVQKRTTLNLAKFMERKNNSFETTQQPSQLKSIILMARQHSGQTQSSFVLEGIVDFLMTNSQLDQVKKNYIFFIFPMINVDGVKYGHYRTNLCGIDLNRIWRVPRKQIHPQVYYMKKLMLQINKNYPISFILDIHGHSKSLNSFFYGNPSKKQNLTFDDPKIFPYICSKRIKQLSYKQSTFNIKQQKKNSARVVLSEMFPKALVYTLQNSFYGYIQQNNKQQTELNSQDQIKQFTPQVYRKVGRELMSTYLQYTRLCEKNTSVKAKWMKQMQGIYAEMQKSRAVGLNEDNGSDSQLQNQLIEFQQKTQSKLIRNDSEPSNLERFQKKIQKQKLQTNQTRSNIFRRIEKKKTMPLPKTICEENVRGVTSQIERNMKSLNDLYPQGKQVNQNKQNYPNNGLLNQSGKPQYPQAVLSIFKIETQKSNMIKKKSSMNSFLNYQDLNNKRILKEKSMIFASRNQYQVKNQAIQEQKVTIHKRTKLKSNETQNKMNIQDVISKCQGMKTFLKAMGITIENRKT